MAKKKAENYQHKMKCPKCTRRKIYIIAEDEGYRFSCKACGYSWKV